MTVQQEVRRLRNIVTPEGLDLALEIAPVGSRMSALGLDLLILFSMLVVLVLVKWGSSGFGGDVSTALDALFILVAFIILNGYFIFFELYWRGVTPGKKAVGLKVISRTGGPLTTSAVFARNLMRDLELYFPLQVLLVPEAFYGSAPGWAMLLASLWIFIFLLMPLFNYDRARCGDLVAGTLVVVQPEGRLLDDPALRTKQEGDAASRFQFSPKQLDMYGIKELQTLEEIIRYDIYEAHRRKLVHMVCEKIIRKIAWSEPLERKDEVDFLKAFYRAQRRHLEERLLMGDRREKKKKGRLRRIRK